MIKGLENEIRELKRRLAEIQREQAALRLQPCRGDSEIKAKDPKFQELDKRAREMNDYLRDLIRRRQLLTSEPAKKEATIRVLGGREHTEVMTVGPGRSTFS